MHKLQIVIWQIKNKLLSCVIFMTIKMYFENMFSNNYFLQHKIKRPKILKNEFFFLCIYLDKLFKIFRILIIAFILRQYYYTQ